MKIQLICFDLGGVLIRIADNWADASALAGLSVGIDPMSPLVHEYLAATANGIMTGQLDMRSFVGQIAKRAELLPHQVMQASAAWLCGPFPGVGTLIESVVASEVQTACLSNTNDHHWQLMTTNGNSNFLPLDRLDHRFASHLIGYAKPASGIYAHVEEATGISAESILFFDDIAANVEAAQKRGWLAYKIDQGSGPVVQMTQHLQEHGVL